MWAPPDRLLNVYVQRRRRGGVGLVLFVVLLYAGCGSEEPLDPNAVRSHLSGRITLSSEVDSTDDQSGFEILVVDHSVQPADTLARVPTDASGSFETTITAPGRGIYSLIIGRDGMILRNSELAVAEGDTARFSITFPSDRQLLISSPENAALMGYKNTKTIHNREVAGLLQRGEVDEDALGMRIRQTAHILWSLRENMPNTIGAELGAADAITMLESWDDSLLLARMRELEPDNVNYARAAGVARRVRVREEGPEAGAALLHELIEKADNEETRASLRAELVIAYRDNRQVEEALATARDMVAEYPETEWAAWAERAIYDLEYLMPGMPAPAFSLTSWEGDPIRSDSLLGRPYVLEFFSPGDDYARFLPLRNAYFDAGRQQAVPFEVISVSLLPDTLLTQAFLEGREMKGWLSVPEGGAADRIVEDYNVHVVPTRFLFDAEGRIVGKYVLENVAQGFEEALALSEQAAAPS